MTNILPLYFVECDFGKLGTSFLETGRDQSSRSQVVRDIASGQIENVVRVLEIFEDEGTCRDVTDDIALEVREHLYANLDRFSHAPLTTQEFVEAHCEAVA